MMNSFARQEGGGFRRRKGKLVSPVRRDQPLHQQTPRNEKEGEETRRKRGGIGEKKKLVREKK